MSIPLRTEKRDRRIELPVVRPELSRNLVENHGITRAAIARPIGVSTSAVSRILAGSYSSWSTTFLATVGGTTTERYTALMQDVFQAALIQPPLDARGKKEGLNVIYNLKDLGLPFIYSSLFALKDRWSRALPDERQTP